jgi:hypothetical protein
MVGMCAENPDSAVAAMMSAQDRPKSNAQSIYFVLENNLLEKSAGQPIFELFMQACGTSLI